MRAAIVVVLFASTLGPATAGFHAGRSAASHGAASSKRDSSTRDSRPMRAPAEVEVLGARELVIEGTTRLSPPSGERVAAAPLERVAPIARPVVVPRKVEPDFRASLEHAMESLPICRHGVEGPGSAEVTFLPDGSARVALGAPYAHTETGACIARRLARAAAAFEGDPVTERVRFAL